MRDFATLVQSEWGGWKSEPLRFCPTAKKLAHRLKSSKHVKVPSARHQKGATHLLEDLREGSGVDLDKLLQLVEVIAEEAEGFFQDHVFRRELGDGDGLGLERSLLLQEGVEAQFQLGLLLQVELVDLLKLALEAEEEGCFVRLEGGLWVQQTRLILGMDNRGGAQFLDELGSGSGNAKITQGKKKSKPS